MKIPTNFLSGLAGAIVLTTIHESMRKVLKDAPRINQVGAEAVRKSAGALGIRPPKGKPLYVSAIAADIVTNALYFSMVGKGGKRDLWLRGIAYGITAGLGALGLTKPAGLDDKPIRRTPLTSLLTVAWYTAGGLASAAAAQALQNTAQGAQK